MGEVTSGELVRAALGGERRAYDALVERFYGMVYTIAFARLDDGDLANDLAQEVFLRAYLCLGKLDNPDAFPGWITRMARNLAVDWLRRGNLGSRIATMIPLEESHEEIADTHTQGARQKMENSETSHAVRAAIRQLPVEQREVVLLHFVDNMTQEEIGAQLGVHRSSVGRLLERALTSLRTLLTPAMLGTMPTLRAPKSAVARTIVLVGVVSGLAASQKSALAATAGLGIQASESHATAAGVGSGFAGIAALLKSAAVIVTGGSEGMAAKAIVASIAVALAGGGLFYVVQGRNSTRAAATPNPPLPNRTNTGVGMALSAGAQFTVIQDDTLTNPQNLGWAQYGVSQTVPRLQATSYRQDIPALLATTAADPGKNYADIGWFTTASNQSLSYASVGTGNIVRAKYYIFATGQTGASYNQIPSFCVRVANGFAVSAFTSVITSDANAVLDRLKGDIAPSQDPESPSVYKVDLDPIEVPALVAGGSRETYLRAFEIYDNNPQANGSIGMTECQLGIYPGSLVADSGAGISPVTASTGLIKSYRAGPGGGDFGYWNGNSHSPNASLTFEKQYKRRIDNSPGQPRGEINASGIVMDTLMVPTDRMGVAAFDMFGGTDEYPRTTATRLISARVEPGKMYKVKFHATSTVNANRQTQIRFRARSLNFGWTSSLEINGANALGLTGHTHDIDSQALPGIGNQLPLADRSPGDTRGGWYTVLMNSPMDPDINGSQPNIAAQDGPGMCTDALTNDRSRRDLQVGVDVRYNLMGNAGPEQGQVQVDGVQIYKLNAVK